MLKLCLHVTGAPKQWSHCGPAWGQLIRAALGGLSLLPSHCPLLHDERTLLAVHPLLPTPPPINSPRDPSASEYTCWLPPKRAAPTLPTPRTDLQAELPEENGSYWGRHTHQSIFIFIECLLQVK